MKFIVSQRGKSILIYQGYIYNYDSEKDFIKRYRCNIRVCTGYLSNDNGLQIIYSKEHNHPDLNEKITKLKVKFAIKRAAKETKIAADEIKK